MAKIKKAHCTNYWQGCGATGNLVYVLLLER